MNVQTTTGNVSFLNWFVKYISVVASKARAVTNILAVPHCIFTGLSIVVSLRFTFTFSASGIVVKSILSDQCINGKIII